MTSFDEPLKKVVGRSAAPLESALGISTVGELLRHYPRRYAQRGELTPIASLEHDEHVTVVAKVSSAVRRPMKNRQGTWLDIEVTDGKEELHLAFFGKGAYVAEQRLTPGTEAMFSGKVSVFTGGRTKRVSLTHPEYESFDETEETAEEFASALVPIYPSAQGLPSWKIRRAVRTVLDVLDLDDPVPAEIRERLGLLPIDEALRRVHRPRGKADVARSHDRLKFDEAFVLQAVLVRRRMAASTWLAKPRPGREDGLLREFDKRLPFQLTEGQRRVGEEIAADLARDHPMHRLLQGEVGAGKTVVALRAMLQVVDSGGQAVLLAPTEVLAQQHHRSIVNMLGDLATGGMFGGTTVALLTGSMGAAARRAALLDAASGAAGIVIGTHAVLQEHVQFADLGLVVVDEQHRFGVEQRDALREKGGGGRPHVLVMTATPIPRTVAMTVFGDLEVSTLSQLPSGRAPITTHVVPAADKPHYLDRAWQRIREEVGLGRQAYVVCPRIGDQEGDEGDLTKDDDERRPPLAVLDVARTLAEGPLAGLRIEALHGKLAPEDKDAVMRAFARGEIDVLVATTVIEVGVDVPNSSVMVIMDADRFGVSQLHQLRGRVGRGGLPGLCLLVTEAPEGTAARRRLDAVAATLDGFELSRVDLEQRREGDVLGAAQSGRKSSLKLLQLLRDEDVIETARTEAISLLSADPELSAHPGLRAEIDAMVTDERAEFLEKA
ncbi:ATP-dependent DNA helicase RecG [Microbispora rosea subsp. aerata]|nr:ATP-dependent DNA helicase RecG [Microbispora rosea]GGO04605.1 ATP-dependent DNA helicase RecG [Microbispora rosea subsp. aerata]GIH56304.1 ATP-dependent DNA helicase RecG [Microbispora rosea subsp. aerata]GLJ82256.1 ATP-dependent DNA helicase RecG [Microbispora rosea subsp. aerata]